MTLNSLTNWLKASRAIGVRSSPGLGTGASREVALMLGHYAYELRIIQPPGQGDGLSSVLVRSSPNNLLTEIRAMADGRLVARGVKRDLLREAGRWTVWPKEAWLLREVALKCEFAAAEAEAAKCPRG